MSKTLVECRLRLKECTLFRIGGKYNKNERKPPEIEISAWQGFGPTNYPGIDLWPQHLDKNDSNFTSFILNYYKLDLNVGVINWTLRLENWEIYMLNWYSKRSYQQRALDPRSRGINISVKPRKSNVKIRQTPFDQEARKFKLAYSLE